MAKKQEEDNRDVFDKVADYIAPAVGAVAGGIAGRKLANKRVFNGSKPTKELSDNLRRQADRFDSGETRIFRGDENVTQEWSRKYKKDARRVDRMRSENVAITAGGAGVGAGSGYVAGQEAKKRRK